MRKIIMILAVLTMICLKVEAQRNIPGQKSIGVNVGTVNGIVFRNSDGQKRIHADLTYSTINKNRVSWEFGLNYMKYGTGTIQLPDNKTHYFVSAGLSKALICDPSQTFFLSTGLSGYMGAVMSEIDSDFDFLYGISLRIGLIIFLSDKYSVNFNLIEKFGPCKYLKNFNSVITLGLSYNF